MIVVFQSLSGSPGTSVWSVLTPALWSDEDVPREKVTVEADLAGGVMATRYQLDSAIDVLMAEAGGWRVGDPIVLSAFASKVSDTTWLVPGPRAPESASQFWHTADGAASIAAMAALDARLWLFDVGRATPGGILGPLFAEAAASVLFVRGESEELAKARRRVADLASTGAFVTVAVTGPCIHSASEVAEFLGTKHVHFLPDDGSLVDDSRKVWAGRKGRRREVWSAGAQFASALAEVLEYSPRGVMRVQAEVN